MKCKLLNHAKLIERGTPILQGGERREWREKGYVS
jgi:hypothetical protein